ncbi:terminase small subunit [Treponema pedis]|uniref:terminase small subunit n=1 Tax=Treponema pedis TaxID=409322 RepID=UPI000424D0FE|nr:terminase small subunit [Treponema pedis]
MKKANDTPDKQKHSIKNRSSKKNTDTTVLPDDAVLNTDSLDIGDVKLTEKEKRFVFWYTYPGTDAFQVQSRAAKRAGYKDYTREGYRLRTKETVAKAIKHVLDSTLRINLEEEFHKILELKKVRVHYDIGDYVENEELKDLSDLTPEQRMAIDGIDYKGNEGKKVYVFANRDKAMNDILAIHKAITGGEEESEEDNIEFTAEVLKEGLRVRATTTRKKKEAIRKNVDFLDTASEGSEEL